MVFVTKEVEVWVDEEEILKEASDEEIQKEWEKRMDIDKVITGRIEKRYTLTSASDFLRKSGKVSLAARIDEIMMELEL